MKIKSRLLASLLLIAMLAAVGCGGGGAASGGFFVTFFEFDAFFLEILLKFQKTIAFCV